MGAGSANSEKREQGIENLCHSEERSDVGIRFSFGMCGILVWCKGMRIATTSDRCHWSRNDRLILVCSIFSPLLQSQLWRPLRRPQAASSPRRGAASRQRFISRRVHSLSPPIAGDAVRRAGQRRMQDILCLRLARAVVMSGRDGRLPGLILVLLRHVVSS